MSNLDQLLRGVKEGEGIALPNIPAKVKGRVVHIDGDGVAYIVAADRKDEEKTTMAQAKRHLDDFINNILDYSGAETYKIHMSDGKSGRMEQALLKEYQANRVGKEVPVLLGDVRDYIINNLNSVVVEGMEADDTIAHYMYRETCAGLEPVCVSGDKDLMIIPGLHLDWGNLEMKNVSFEGEVYMDSYTTAGGNKVNKLRGSGGLFFMAQMLMGDSADNISGLPSCHGSLLNVVDPTQEILKCQDIVEGKVKATAKQYERALQKIEQRKPKKCGDVLTYKLLKGLTLKEAVDRVVLAYALYGTTVGFEDYAGNPISFSEAFNSEAKLLYMRHNLDENDFQEFLRAAKHEQGPETFTKPSDKAPNSRPEKG